MTPLRVLHAISGIDPRNGGPTNALIGLAAAQQRAGLNVRVISTWQEQDAFQSARRLEEMGVGVRMVGQAYGKLSRHPDLVRALEEEIAGVDIVHIHALWEEIQHQAARLARRRGVPYVFRPCGMLDPWSLSQSKWPKKIVLAWRLRADLNAAAAIHYTSSDERDASGALGLKPPVIVEPLGVDLREFGTLPEKGVFRAKHPNLAGKKIVMFLGRLHAGKGMEYLVPAFARMRDSDAALVAVGPDSGGFQATLERQIETLGLRDRVLFTGMLRGRERIEALVDAHLFALPSEHENFGISVIEALACGTPVIISEGVAIHREISNAGVGAVAKSDATTLAGEIDRWLGDDALRLSAGGERARAFVWERFDWAKVATRWVGHYRSLSTGAAGAGVD